MICGWIIYLLKDGFKSPFSNSNIVLDCFNLSWHLLVCVKGVVMKAVFDDDSAGIIEFRCRPSSTSQTTTQSALPVNDSV